MAERSLPSGLKTSLLAEDVHTYLHLVKFEKPRSAAESQFIAKKATDYVYISDAPYNVTFDDGSKDSKGNPNNDQIYVANKLLKVGTINETTEAKASNMNIELSGTALGTTLITNATFTSTTITTTSDLLDEGFQEGDVILLEGTGFANNGKYVRIDKFTNSNQTITVTGIDCVVTADSTAREYTFSFASDEIQALLTSKEATNYVNYINREVIIYKAHVNPETGAIIGGDDTGPFVIFRGIISKASVKDNVLQKSKVSWNLTSHWGDFIRVQGRVTSDYSHRALSVTGVSDKDALLRPEYEFDAGFAHAEKSINVLSTYQTMETRYKMKKRGGLAGLIGLKKVVEYQVEVDREVDLQFNLTARYLPVVYGVQRVDSIPIFADINKNIPNHVYVAHAICEGEIGGIYDVYIDENSSVCLDLNDSNARSSTSSNAAVLCNGRADKGDVLAGGSGRTTTTVNFLEDGEEIPFSTFPGGFNSVFRLPQAGTSFNSSGAQGIQHEDTFTFQSPITTNLFIHTGKPHQDANDTLVNQAKLKNFKIQNELAVGDKNNYWSPNHRLLDTAYVVGKYIIKEGDTTIPKLEFVVRGKKIKSYNYDFSYDTDTTGSNAAHTNFTLGTTVTLHRTKAEGSNPADSQIGSAVTIIDKWSFYRNTSTLHYRFRFSANPQDGVSTQFYMKDGSGNKWHMITHDHEDQTTLVNLGTPITGNVTAIGAYNSGAGTSGTRTITISANLPFHTQTSTGHFVCFNFSGIETTEAFRVVSTNTSNNTIVVNDNGRGLNFIKQLLDAGNTCTLRNMNMIVLNASAAPSVDDAYNGRKIIITRFDSDDTILKEEERQIVTYETASSPLPKIATLDVPMPFDFSPEATDFYVIHSGEDEEDIRVSINPAIQLLDYLKDKKHGKGLDDSDIDFPSFLQAARDCETRSDVTIQAVGDVTGSVAVGDVYQYAPSSVVKFQGTVKSRETKVVNVTADNGSVTATTFTQIIFNNVIGKLAYKWTNWRTFADNDYYWNKGLLYLKSGSGTVTVQPTSGHLTSNISLSKVGGGSLTVSIQDTYNSSGNPVIKKFTNIVEGFNSPGYSLYDSDDVKYWIYLGWDEPEQRFVTRHQMNQIIDTSVPIFNNINSMLKQFNGILRYANGKYGLAIKQAAPASFEAYQTITDDDIIGEINVQDGGQKQSFNSMAANVIDPQNKFNARSITYFNSDYLKQDKGIRRSGNFAMPGVSNYFNSRINIQQYLDESRYGLDISFKIDSKGLLLLTGEIIRVTNSRLGFNNKLFRISNLNFMSNCLVQVTAVEHNDSAYFVANIKTAPAAKEIEDQGGTVNETAVATPDSPSGLTATTNAKGAIDLSWSNSSSFSTATHMTEVFASSTNDRTNATSIFNTQATVMSHLITVQSLTTKYYWVRHTVVAENGQIVNSDFHPTSSTGGVVGSATGAVDGAPGDRGAGRWHIQVSSLPTTSALANSRWSDGSGNQPTVAVVGDQAFFYTGTLSSPTAQKVWIYAGSNNWTEQVEVIDGDLLVQGTVTADRMNVTTLSSITADIGSITAGTVKGGSIPDANAAPSGSEAGAFMDLTNGKMVFGKADKHILFDGTNLQLSGVVIDSSSVVNSTAGVIVQEDASQEASAATTLNFTTGLNVAVTGSAPTQTATISLDSGLATLASPTFTGNVLLPDQTSILPTVSSENYVAGTGNNNLAATTRYVEAAISSLINGAPGTLNTLNELAEGLNDDDDAVVTINTALTNRLRVDTSSQNLSSTQKANALTNLGISSGSGVTSVSGDTPISVTSGATPTVSISAATTSAAGSLSAADKTQLDNLSTNLSAKAPLANPTFTGTVAGITKSMVGLGNVDNTSDANKPVSTAQQTALNAKANLSGATFSGAIAMGTNKITGLGTPTSTTDAATKAYVDSTSSTAAGGASGTTYTTSIPSSTTKLRLLGSDLTEEDIEFVGSGSTTVTRTNDSKFTISSSQFSHPTHDGDDIDIDTTPLTGATVISDLDFNITTDTLGHVTDANGTVATRDLTLADLGYSGAANATANAGTVTSVSGGTGITISGTSTIDPTVSLTNMAQNTVKGRTSSGSGAPEDLAPSALRLLLNVEDGAQEVSIGNLSAVSGSFGELAADVANITDLRVDFLDADKVVTRDLRVGPTTSVTAGNFVTNRDYTILTTGNTNFVSVGAPASAVGAVFTATGAGSGTGTARDHTTVANIATSTTAASAMAVDEIFIITNLGSIGNNAWSTLAGTTTNSTLFTYRTYAVGDIIKVAVANGSLGSGTGIKLTGTGSHLTSAGDFLLGDVAAEKFLAFSTATSQLSLAKNIRFDSSRVELGTIISDQFVLKDTAGKFLMVARDDTVRLYHDEAPQVFTQGAGLEAETGSGFISQYYYAKNTNGINFAYSAFTGSSTTQMFISNAGDVAIGNGATAPTNHRLHIKTAVDNSVSQGLVIERSNVVSDRGYINYQGGAFRFVATDGDPIKLGHVSNDNRLEITASGAVKFNNTYTFPTADGSANQVLQTDGSGTLTFATISSGGSSTFVGLSDTPANFSSAGGKYVKVNSSANALEFDTLTFSDLGSKPTTIAGYGITDALELGTSSTTALAGNTALLQLGTSSTTALAGNTALLQLGTSSTTALAGNTSIPSVLTDLSISDGTNGQFLKTNGSGGFTFATVSASDSTKLPLTGGTLTGALTVTGDLTLASSNRAIGSARIGLRFQTGYNEFGAVYPYDVANSANSDNKVDLGQSNARFDDVYATNGTIQTSDINEKQDIRALTDAETRVAIAAKSLLKVYRWKNRVTEVGANARLHFGIIAQELQTAFEAEGLDAGDYGMFISNTSTDDSGNEQTRLGVRYSELLAFIIAST